MNIEKFVKLSPIFSILEANLSIQRSLSRFTNDKLSFLQAMILISVFFEKGKNPSPGALAKALHASKSGISHAISDLEYANFVKRHLVSSDARKFEIRLTDSGKKLVMRLVKNFDARQRRIEAEIGENGTAKLITHLHLIKALHDE